MKHRAQRGLRPADLGRAPAYVAIVPLAAVTVTSVSILIDRPLPLVLVAAAAGGLLMVLRPRLAVIGMLVFWAGGMVMEYQTIRLGPLKVTLGDLCFWAGVVGVLWQRFGVRAGSAPRPGSASHVSRMPRFLVPIALFMVAVLWGLLVATRAGNSLGESFHSALNLTPLLAYFLIREVYAGRSKVLFQDLVIVTGLLSVAILAAIAVNFEPFIGKSPNVIRTRGMEFEALRIDPPLLRTLSGTLLLATFAGIPRSPRLKMLRWVLVAAMLAVEAYSMTRTTWAPLLAVWLALPVMARGRAGLRSAFLRGTAVMVVLVVGLGVAATGSLGTTAQAMAVRAISVTDDDVTQDESLQDRLVEDEMALGHIRNNPLGGIGFPRPYGAFQYEYDVDQDLTRYIDKLFIHQTYLGLWMWFGILGVLSVLVLAAYIGRAYWLIWNMRYRDASAPVAALGGVIVLAVSSMFQTNLLYRPAYFALAIGLACIDLWIAERDLPRHQLVDNPNDRSEQVDGEPVVRRRVTKRVPAADAPAPRGM